MNAKLTEAIIELQADIAAIEKDASLYEEINFDSRADAIDFIDFHIIDRIDGWQPDKEHDLLKHRAKKVKCALEAVDMRMFEQLRKQIKNGMYTGSSFAEMIRKYVRTSSDGGDNIGYDNLDIFINGLLFIDAIPDPIRALESDMVFYQKTPARIVFEMAGLLNISQDDCFFDIGSGLGQTAILVNLISGASSTGIEYEVAYCEYARKCASQLNLPKVTFTNGDACKAGYSCGTVFFMYTPFEGSMLQEVLNRLQNESLKRTIRIFTYGPCSLLVGQQNWLTGLTGTGDDPYKLYEFESLHAGQY
jgi:SAM-dependent methyltransferase